MINFSRFAAQKHIRGLLNSRWADAHLSFLYCTINIIQWMIYLQVWNITGQHKNKQINLRQTWSILHICINTHGQYTTPGTCPKCAYKISQIFSRVYDITCLLKVTPKIRGDLMDRSTYFRIYTEYTFRLELSMYGICCSYIVLANPNMKLRIQFIIMKIIMKIVKICPKSPRFTVQYKSKETPQLIGLFSLNLVITNFMQCFLYGPIG